MNVPGVAGIADALRLAGGIAAAPVSRRSIRAAAGETTRSLPGDELVADAELAWTHGITVAARAADVWPWLIQMGCRRAGWYSYDALDNGGVASADRVVPELQHAAVGDVFPMTPTAEDTFVVRAVEPGRALVLGDATGAATWAFALEPVGEEQTRIVTRVRAAVDRPLPRLLFTVAWRPIHCGMERRQLLNLAQRVEAAAA